MATVATMHATHVRPTPVPIAPSPSRTRPSSSTARPLAPSLSNGLGPLGKSREATQSATCDGCRRRNSRCAMNERVGKCYSCDFHRQECIFSPTWSRKRSFDDATEGTQSHVPNKQARAPPFTSASKKSVEASDDANGVSVSQGKNEEREERQIRRYIGASTDLELSLFEVLPSDALPLLSSGNARVERLSIGTYMELLPSLPSESPHRYDELQRLADPHGQTLIEFYLAIVQPVLPLLSAEDVLSLKSRRSTVDVALLASIYLLSTTYRSVLDAVAVAKIEDLASNLLQEAFVQPRLSTIQAGLIMSQIESINTALLNMQINAAAFDLGLHQDCSIWTISAAHKALRKRLAWAVYAHDKWTSLSNGRPSLIAGANWTVLPLLPTDFDPSCSPVPSVELFTSYITLSTILSSVLDIFYTLSSATLTSPQQILSLAKPVQLQLKDWYSQLPTCLKMENPASNPSASSPTSGASSPEAHTTSINPSHTLGFLHLAYFTTEILLHRRIIRSLSPSGIVAGYTPLHHICRLAAKTRLISALDFLNRLHAPHLSTFWQSSYTQTQLAMIGSFGTLLLSTSPTVEEESFYAARLEELRWTLDVCSAAGTLSFASRRSSSSSQGLGHSVAHVQESKDQLGFKGALWKLDLGLELWERSCSVNQIVKGSVKEMAAEMKQSQAEGMHSLGQGGGCVPLNGDVMNYGMNDVGDEGSEIEGEMSEDESED